MPFKLSIENTLDPSDKETVEYECDAETARIGRHESNDVRLGDPRRIVSGRHAEIRQKGDRFFLIDVGSKNGTRLNGEPLIPEKEYPLKEKDQIAIGHFILHFFPVLLEAATPEGIEVSDATLHFQGTAEGTQLLLEALSRVYADHPENREERRSRIAEILRRGISGVDETAARRFLDLVEIRFPEPEYQQERLKRTPAEPLSLELPQELKAADAAYTALRKLAARYSDNGKALDSPEDVTAFIARIERILSVMVDSLADAVKGRREFEEEFEVESTRIFMRKPNPIKAAEGSREIGRYLLNMKNPESTEKVVADLEDLFTDLALHQVGMIAGFREGLRGLLKELDPDSFEEKERGEGGFRIGPWVKSAAWDRFREKHRALSEEEVRTFEQILGPYFAEGYLSIQKRKKSSS